MPAVRPPLSVSTAAPLHTRTHTLSVRARRPQHHDRDVGGCDTANGVTSQRCTRMIHARQCDTDRPSPATPPFSRSSSADGYANKALKELSSPGCRGTDAYRAGSPVRTDAADVTARVT